jgi:hypothetical protein
VFYCTVRFVCRIATAWDSCSCSVLPSCRICVTAICKLGCVSVILPAESLRRVPVLSKYNSVSNWVAYTHARPHPWVLEDEMYSNTRLGASFVPGISYLSATHTHMDGMCGHMLCVLHTYFFGINIKDWDIIRLFSGKLGADYCNIYLLENKCSSLNNKCTNSEIGKRSGPMLNVGHHMCEKIAKGMPTCTHKKTSRREGGGGVEMGSGSPLADPAS